MNNHDQKLLWKAYQMTEDNSNTLGDMVGHSPEDYDGRDSELTTMDRPAGNDAFNSLEETLQDINKHVRLQWAGFDEENVFMINNVMVKVIGFAPSEENIDY